MTPDNIFSSPIRTTDAYLALTTTRHRQKTPRIIALFSRITRTAIYKYAAKIVG